MSVVFSDWFLLCFFSPRTTICKTAKSLTTNADTKIAHKALNFMSDFDLAEIIHPNPLYFIYWHLKAGLDSCLFHIQRLKFDSL